MAERRVGRIDAAMAALQEKLAQLKQQASEGVKIGVGGAVTGAKNLEQMIIDQASGRRSRARTQQISNVADRLKRKVDQGSDEIFNLLATALNTTPAEVKQRIQIYGPESVLQDAAGNMAKPPSFNTAYQAVNEAIANDPNVRRVGGPLAAAAGAVAGTGALMEWNDPDRGFAIVAGPNVNQAAMQDIMEFLENGDPLRRETETIA